MANKILIVDDSTAIRRTVRSWIESTTEWKVCGEAGDGETAVRMVQQLKPDVVLLDVAMPVMDGIQAAEEIAATTPHSQIVFLTNYPSQLLSEYARRVGAKAVLAKDGQSTLVQLVSTMRKLLDTA